MVKHHYHWKGVDRQGRLCTGALHANAPASVVATLQKERIRVIRIQRQWNVTAWIYAHQPKHLTPAIVLTITAAVLHGVAMTAGLIYLL